MTRSARIISCIRPTGKGSLSAVTTLLLLVFVAWGNLFYVARWNKSGPNSPFADDVQGYYWYLPSYFIYHNLRTQNFSPDTLSRLQPSGRSTLDNAYQVESSGNYVLKYAAGMAVLYSPAFFSGHCAALLFGYPADGFSLPYRLALNLWALIVFAAGIIVLRKVLLYYYSDRVAAIVLFVLVAGTNYLTYTTTNAGMSHPWLFTLYSLLFYCTHQYYTRQKGQYLLACGAICGLMTLARPTEISAVLIPLLWSVGNRSWREKLSLWGRHWYWVIAAICCCGLILCIQLYYWHHVSGHWLEYSYGKEGFHFKAPHFREYCLDYRTGWLRYCPMMWLCIPALLVFMFRGHNRWALSCLILLNFYVVCSWETWDYGFYSGRAMLQTYAAMAFPFAALVQLCLERRILLLLFAPFALLGVYVNIWWAYHLVDGSVLDRVSNSSAFYWKSVGRWHIPEEWMRLRDNSDLFEGTPRQLELIARDTNSQPQCINYKKEYIDPIIFNYTGSGKSWIRVSADFTLPVKDNNFWRNGQFIVMLRKGDHVVQERMMRVPVIMAQGATRHLYMDTRIPATAFDHVEIHLWHPNDAEEQLCLEHLTLEGFNE